MMDCKTKVAMSIMKRKNRKRKIEIQEELYHQRVEAASIVT